MQTSVTIPVVGDFEDEGTETFTVTLSCPNRLTIGDGVGVGSIVNTSPPSPVTFGGPGGPLNYVRPDRGPVVISLKGPGIGSAFFATDAAEPGRITLDGTTAASSLNVSGDAALPDIIINGSLRSLGGRTADLAAGDITVSGSISRLTFNDVEAGSVTIRGDRPLTFVAERVVALSLDAAGPIRSMRVTDWRDRGFIKTPLLSSLTATGRMSVSIDAGAIGRIKAGFAPAATVRAERSIGSFNVVSLENSLVFAGVAPGLDTLPDSPDDFVNPGARIGSVRISHFRGSCVAAPRLGRIDLGAASGTWPFNGGRTFSGAAGHSIRSLSAVAGTDSLRFSKIDDPADSRVIGDFVLRLL